MLAVIQAVGYFSGTVGGLVNDVLFTSLFISDEKG